MAFCTNCGSPINEKFAFCIYCGAKLDKNAGEAVSVTGGESVTAVKDSFAEASPVSEEKTVIAPEENPVPTVEPLEEKPEGPIEKPTVEPTPEALAAPTFETAIDADDELTQVIPSDSLASPTAEDDEKTVALGGNDRGAQGNSNTMPFTLPIDDEKTQVVSKPSYDRPPAEDYEQKYSVPYGPEGNLPLGKDKYQSEPYKKGKYGVVSAWYYFLMALLYAIPLVGLVMSIVMSFGGTINVNKRGFARSILVFKFIGIGLLLAALIFCIFFQAEIFDFFSSLFGKDVEAWGDIIKAFEE